MRILLPILLLFLSLPVFAQVPVEEFHRQMRDHRSRLKAAAHYLVEVRPDVFGSLSNADIDKYMEMHDRPKLQSLKELRRWGYTHEKDIGTRLAAFNGHKPQSAAELRELADVVKSLNVIEDRQKESFLSRRSDDVVSKLKLLERVVDVTDTGIMRRKEMGIPADDPPPSEFLKKYDRDPLAVELAEHLQEHYSEATRLSVFGVSCRRPNL